MPKKEIINKIEYISFRALLAGFSLMPASWALGILKALFYVIGYGIGIRKKVAYKQLARVYPDKTPEQLRAILKSMYRSMAISVFEIYLMDDETLFAKSQITGQEHIQKALSFGRGAILATAHYGNWEAARVLPKAGIPLSVITKAQRNNLFDTYTNAIRKRSGLRVIDMRKGLRDIIHQFGEGRVVAILMDQNAGKSGLMLDFLGYKASHWKGVAKLSLRYKVPIVPGFARRGEDDKIVFEFYEPIMHEAMEDIEENYSIILSEVNSIIEQQIHKWPQQWFWVHKRWKHGYDKTG